MIAGPDAAAGIARLRGRPTGQCTAQILEPVSIEAQTETRRAHEPPSSAAAAAAAIAPWGAAAEDDAMVDSTTPTALRPGIAGAWGGKGAAAVLPRPRSPARRRTVGLSQHNLYSTRCVPAGRWPSDRAPSRRAWRRWQARPPACTANASSGPSPPPRARGRRRGHLPARDANGGGAQHAVMPARDSRSPASTRTARLPS